MTLIAKSSPKYRSQYCTYVWEPYLAPFCCSWHCRAYILQCCCWVLACHHPVQVDKDRLMSDWILEKNTVQFLLEKGEIHGFESWWGAVRHFVTHLPVLLVANTGCAMPHPSPCIPLSTGHLTLLHPGMHYKTPFVTAIQHPLLEILGNSLHIHNVHTHGVRALFPHITHCRNNGAGNSHNDDLVWMCLYLLHYLGPFMHTVSFPDEYIQVWQASFTSAIVIPALC